MEYVEVTCLQSLVVYYGCIAPVSLNFVHLYNKHNIHALHELITDHKHGLTSKYIQQQKCNICIIFNIKAKGQEGHLHCSTQNKFKQQYMVADKSYLLSTNNR